MISRHRVRAALLAATLALICGCGESDDEPGGETSASAQPAATATETTAASGPQLGEPTRDMTSLPGALNSDPPWPANNGASLQLRLRAIGFEPLTEEGQVVHTHQHLDLYVDGERVTLPANIGVDAGQAFISDLHTHDRRGIMHVESPTQRTFTLGEFFAVWGLPLSPRCIGSRCASGAKRLRVWVNGDEVSADPTRIVLADRQQITIAYGTDAQVPDPVPDTYDFVGTGF